MRVLPQDRERVEGSAGVLLVPESSNERSDPATLHSQGPLADVCKNMSMAPCFDNAGCGDEQDRRAGQSGRAVAVAAGHMLLAWPVPRSGATRRSSQG